MDAAACVKSWKVSKRLWHFGIFSLSLLFAFYNLGQFLNLEFVLSGSKVGPALHR